MALKKRRVPVPGAQLHTVESIGNRREIGDSTLKGGLQSGIHDTPVFGTRDPPGPLIRAPRPSSRRLGDLSLQSRSRTSLVREDDPDSCPGRYGELYPSGMVLSVRHQTFSLILSQAALYITVHTTHQKLSLAVHSGASTGNIAVDASLSWLCQENWQGEIKFLFSHDKSVSREEESTTAIERVRLSYPEFSQRLPVPRSSSRANPFRRHLATTGLEKRHTKRNETIQRIRPVVVSPYTRSADAQRDLRARASLCTYVCTYACSRVNCLRVRDGGGRAAARTRTSVTS